ncbi:MAG TPA: 2Fe-2S iron-sulfur cluster-binding protein [Fimbriimonas sp.]|nr:2Fe-2S iron-sulfur cluster-binding protein [Fimbriimonas sp.]
MTTQELDPAPPAIGDLAPDFESVLPDGTVARLRDLAGHPVVLAFFPAQWDPARQPQIELYNRALGEVMPDSNIVRVSQKESFLDADVSGEGEVRVYVLDSLDSNGEIADLFGVRGEQALFVLDGHGVVRWHRAGPVGGYPPADEIKKALSEVKKSGGVSRRQFVFAAVATFAAMALMPKIGVAEPRAKAQTKQAAFALRVNGREYKVPADNRMSLLDALRERIGLTGTKKGCDHGQCGACTVHMDGRRVNSCLVLAAQAEGSHIETIEGLAHGDRLHPVQEAFIKHDSFQCGYCTPGQIMSAVSCIKEGHTGSPDEIKEWMSGNICRCGAYQGILEAIQEAKGK